MRRQDLMYPSLIDQCRQMTFPLSDCWSTPYTQYESWKSDGKKEFLTAGSGRDTWSFLPRTAKTDALPILSLEYKVSWLYESVLHSLLRISDSSTYYWITLPNNHVVSFTFTQVGRLIRQ